MPDVKDDGSSAEELFERYVESVVVKNVRPNLDELCCGDLELMKELRGKVDTYHQLEDTLGSMRRLTPGRRLGGYEVIDEIGRGGMGFVYSARELETGRLFALKLLASALSKDPESLRRFEREARVVRKLEHPAIVRLHSIEAIEGMHILVLDLVLGEPINRLLPVDGFPVPEVLRIGEALAGALDSVHGVGVVHRDLKLSNLMLDVKGELRILDFGLARDQEASLESLTRTGAVVGSVCCMAPEQLLGERIDARADLFALGGILYELATGRAPFSGRSLTEIIDAILSDEPSFALAGLEGDLGNIVRKCLEKEAVARPASASEVESALRDLRGKESGGEAPMTAKGERDA